MVLEKPNPKVPSSRRQWWEIRVWCRTARASRLLSGAGGFRFVAHFSGNVRTRGRRGVGVCFDMFVGFSEVYEVVIPEKGSSNREKNSEMLPAVPMGDVDALFHGYE